MRKRLILVLPIVALAGWYFLKHYEIEGLEDLGIQPRDVQKTASDPQQSGLPPARTEGDTIRIATFNVHPLDDAKLANRHVAGHLVKLIRGFDVVALQHVVAGNRSLLVKLLEQVNADGRHYTFATGPREEDSPDRPLSVLLFDQASVEIDPSTVWLIEDPANRLRHRPLVAAFRARGPEPTQAFTFTLVSVYVSLDQAAQELDLMDEVFRRVRDDGRNEDDIILLGDLSADDRHLTLWEQTLHLTWAISRTPSTTRGTRLSDNILFDRRATVEYTGRSDVLDVMRELDLSTQEASEISDHLPVWAEFSIYEGGHPGSLASRPGKTIR